MAPSGKLLPRVMTDANVLNEQSRKTSTSSGPLKMCL
jgi:hypothetical protein